MDCSKGPLPIPGSLARLLLTMIAFSGEFPTTQIGRLPGTEHYRQKVVKALKRDGFIRTYYRDGLRGLRLTAAAKKLLLDSQPERYLSLFTGDTATNAPKYSVPHRLRLHRMAEVLVTMHNAGIPSFPWEKPAVFQPVPPLAESYIGQAAYYSSREVKEIGPQATQFRGSRAVGVLLSDGGVFAVYNTAGTQMKWEYKAEIRLRAMLQTDLCRGRLAERFMDMPPNAMVFGTDMGQLLSLMGPGDPGKRNYIVQDGSFPQFHYLTNDHYGEVLLRLLCDPSLREVLDEILSEDLSAPIPGWKIDHDALDEKGEPVLFGYTCDMPRIRRFDAALELHGQRGTLICFDFQAEALGQACGPRVTLQHIDFSAFERSVVHNP